MSKTSEALYGFFSDSDGNRSFGRLFAAVCIYAAIIAFFVGYYSEIPKVHEYCEKFQNLMTSTATWLYGSSKGQQAASSVANLLQGMKPSTAPLPPPPAAPALPAPPSA